MKTSFRLFSLLGLIFLLTGCSAQRSAPKPFRSDKSAALWQQAQQALDARWFIIRIDEFFFPGTSSVQASSENQISMQGQRGEIHFSPRIFPRSPLEHLNIIDESSTLTPLKSKRNGDLQFEMTVDGDKKWLRNKLLITVYHNTNRCFVQVKSGYYDGQDAYRFTGEILPLTE